MSSQPAAGGHPAEQPDVAALYARYREAMRRVAAAALAGTSVDPQDAVMRVIVNLQGMHATGALQGIDNWEAYLVRSVRNEAIGLAENAARERPVEDADLAVLLERMPSGPSEHVVVERIEWQRRLDRLDPRKRAIIEGLFLEDLTLAQLGAQWGITPQRVGQLRDQAFREMREE
jgi:RNA polymerase sigma factor (sigma-70 family)